MRMKFSWLLWEFFNQQQNDFEEQFLNYFIRNKIFQLPMHEKNSVYRLRSRAIVIQSADEISKNKTS